MQNDEQRGRPQFRKKASSVQLPKIDVKSRPSVPSYMQVRDLDLRGSFSFRIFLRFLLFISKILIVLTTWTLRWSAGRLYWWRHLKSSLRKRILQFLHLLQNSVLTIFLGPKLATFQVAFSLVLKKVKLACLVSFDSPSLAESSGVKKLIKNFTTTISCQLFSWTKVCVKWQWNWKLVSDNLRLVSREITEGMQVHWSAFAECETLVAFLSVSIVGNFDLSFSFCLFCDCRSSGLHKQTSVTQPVNRPTHVTSTRQHFGAIVRRYVSTSNATHQTHKWRPTVFRTD